MGRLFTPFQQFFDRNGNPLSDGKVTFFVNQDLSNLQATYSDPNLNNQNTNPVILDGEGRVPDVFGDGVYTVTLRDKNNVLIDTLNTVGGDIGSRTAFSDWTSTIIYNIPAIVVGSDGQYYQSISNNNLNNDPISSPNFWEEIRFIRVYNEFVTYSEGDIVQTADGNEWKSVIDDNLNNNPSNDDGANWLPNIDGGKVPEIIKITWQNVNADFTAENNESYQIDASANDVSATLPAIAATNSFTFHNETISTNTVLILNPAYTINGPNGTVPAGTDIELQAGDSVQLVAKSSTVLEVVGAQA